MGQPLAFVLCFGRRNGRKCVSGGVDVVYVNGTSNRNMEHNSLDVDPLQWSVSAAAGVQVNFTKNIGLYAEPGIAYYLTMAVRWKQSGKSIPLILICRLDCASVSNENTRFYLYHGWNCIKMLIFAYQNNAFTKL